MCSNTCWQGATNTRSLSAFYLSPPQLAMTKLLRGCAYGPPQQPCVRSIAARAAPAKPGLLPRRPSPQPPTTCAPGPYIEVHHARLDWRQYLPDHPPRPSALASRIMLVTPQLVRVAIEASLAASSCPSSLPHRKQFCTRLEAPGDKNSMMPRLATFVPTRQRWEKGPNRLNQS